VPNGRMILDAIFEFSSALERMKIMIVPNVPLIRYSRGIVPSLSTAKSTSPL
jgi:hypothetical protein